MNRYPLWTYVIVACALVLGFTYTLPNFFGESPAVQVSSIKATVKVDSALLGRVEDALKAANIASQGTFLDPNSVSGVEQVLEERDGSDNLKAGERRHVTVLFADMKGSMEILADLDPEDARRLLDPVIELFRPISPLAWAPTGLK